MRYVCVHGHFYQPPRENPWLEAIEVQDSAYPYHDWNERITAECYAQNAASRILGEDKTIASIVNNYERISFNFGPTLLSWLAEAEPDVYASILEADRRSVERFDGHGSAIAQVYNHTILPLASRRDKVTQVRWGIKDFVHRFGRKPEGMWLAECAVDTETLEVLAEHDIAFTILAPRQCKDPDIDTSRPYKVELPSGSSIAVFFYNAAVSRAVAFERLLASGEAFAAALNQGEGLMHIATDGETYGHHHRHGDMALAFALDALDAAGDAELVNYGAYLERFPAEHTAEIVESSSWSCAHGVERWRSDCGCRTGGRQDWSQAWRAPLRSALDWLRSTLDFVFEGEGGELLKDVWTARDNYIDVMLDRSEDAVEWFLERHTPSVLPPDQRTRVLKLLEMQRFAQLMFTSCGWFFSELSGIETVQVLHYAGRAIQLAAELTGEPIADPFKERLAHAPSNVARYGNGRAIFEAQVEPAVVDLPKLVAHYAASSLFEETPDRSRIYAFDVRRGDYRKQTDGRAQLAIGEATVTSRLTGESATLSFGVLHFGDQNLSGGVREFKGREAYRAMRKEVSDAFDNGDLPEVLRLLDEYFLELTYSMKTLFRDEQRKVLATILSATLDEAEDLSRNLYERHGPLIRYLAGIDYPIPKPVRTAAQFVLNGRLRTAAAADPVDPEQIRALLREAQGAGVELDTAGVSLELTRTLDRTADRWAETPFDLPTLQRVVTLVELVRSLPFHVDLFKVQNYFYRLATRGDHDRQRPEWRAAFGDLGEALHMRIRS